MVDLAPPKISSVPIKRPTRSGFQAVLLLVVIILFSWFIVAPASQVLGSRQAQIKQANNELKDIQDNTANLNSLIQSLKNSQKQVDLLDEALPIDGRFTKIHVLLDQIVKASGMTLAGINVDPGKNVVAGQKNDLEHPFRQERKQNSVDATLSVTGSMEQGVGLLQLLENDARIIDVDAIDVTSDGSGTLAFRFKLIFYFYAPAAAAK